MTLTFREATPDDAETCGRICHEAFAAIAKAHNMGEGMPLPVATSRFKSVIAHPGFYVVVAERDGQIIGSNVLDERSVIAGLGPITVDPAAQDARVGRQLMEHVLARAATTHPAGVRLVQAAYHSRSLALYTQLGFIAREPLSGVQGQLDPMVIPGTRVRLATERDLAACNAVCFAVHGHTREGELEDAIAQSTARVVEQADEITGYATELSRTGHAVGRTNRDIKALIGSVQGSFGGPGILVPTRNAELLSWCLTHKLRIVSPSTLMTMGLYNEPSGAYLASILY